METALRALLISDATLVGLVGANTGSSPGVGPSIYWGDIPQGAKDPAVAMYKISGAPGYHMKGSDGLEASIVQINVRATSVPTMQAVSRAIKDRLSGFRGERDATDFRGIFLRDERTASEKPGTTHYQTSQLDFDIWSRAA